MITMKPYRFSVVTLLGLAVVLCGLCDLGFCREDIFIRMKLGNFDASQNENFIIETLARFAVQQHNKQQNALLEFARVLKAREQVVAGKIYHLTLEAIDSGKKNIYEASVWVKPWMNFKQLQEFKLSHEVPSFTSADLGYKPGKKYVIIYHEVELVRLFSRVFSNWFEPELQCFSQRI